MRTLTEAFAPGSPSLPEGLRTLVVSPDRTVEPGMTVRAVFAFYNLGGAAATGLRARFLLPDGLRYLTGSARIDDVPLEEARGETALLLPAGADIGEVPPGVERRISIAFLVNATIENGATIELQAALASHETGVIGSNVVRLAAKSNPILQNPATVAALEATRNAEPGEEIRVIARVYNSGQSTARDVVVVLPVPDRTSYIPGSARIDGREVPQLEERNDPFGFGIAPIAAGHLAAGATLVVEYRARIDSPLDNNTRLFVSGEVACAEIAEFPLSRAELTVSSASRFEGADTTLVVDAPNEVEPGRRVRVAMVVRNNGTCAADDVRIRLTLPAGLQYAPGSRAVDGRSIGENESAGEFTFERLDAGTNVEVAVDAYVVSPAIDGTSLPVAGSLHWGTGSRTFDRTLTVRSKPRFPQSRNTIALDGSPSVAPGSDVRMAVRIVNDGTSAATNARITIDADSALQSLRYVEHDAEARVQNATIVLGEIEPNASHEIILIGTVASPIADRTEIRINATLVTNETAPLALGALTVTARSRPRFALAGSHLEHTGGEALRPSGTGDIAITLLNEGTDVARDVRLTVDVGSDARIDGVDGATRDGDQILFGDIAAGAKADASLRIRLGRFVARGATVTVRTRLAGAGLLPFALDPLTIATLAEPAFGDGATLRTQPIESVDAGEAMYVQLVARNTGDGSASRLIVRAALPENTAYVLGSTSINDVPLLDAAGGSVLWSKSGLVLEDVDPGVEVSVRYGVIVNTPLAAGTLISPMAELAWDGGSAIPLAAASVRVRSTPAFAVRASGLPFSVAGVAPRTADVLRELAQSPSAPVPMLPPIAATPFAAPPAAASPQAAPAIPSATPPAAAAAPPVAAPPIVVPPAPAPPSLVVRLTFERDTLERALAFIDSGEQGGLITHLFAIQQFFPESVAGLNGEMSGKFTAQRDTLRAIVHRLFIRMRMPRSALTAKDLEDRASRSTLVDLVAALRTAQPSATFGPSGAAISLEGPVDRERIVANLGALESEPIGSARPWLVLAELLGSKIVWANGSSDALGAYRDLLIATLMNVASLPLEEFHRVLTGSSNAALDAALGDARTALRDALEATATVSEPA
jgi:uncharacterized repeat protein (TIGR01451 family)